MDDLKGKEERPWEGSAEKPEKVDEMDRAPLLRRNFQRDCVSIERSNWYRCASTPEPSACDIVISLILFITMASTFVWILVTSHHTNVMAAQAYQSDGETSSTAGQTSFNGMTDCPFHRSWIAVVGRRGLPYSQTEAAQITAVQDALQKAQFSNNCCDHGRKLLQDNPPPNLKTLKSPDFSDSDTNADDYPNPGPSPTPDVHDYPPPALRSEMKPEVHSDDVSDLVPNADDYPNPGPNPSPPDHDYPPPALRSEMKPEAHSDDISDLVTNRDDYPNPGPNPSPPDHDYPPPALRSEMKPEAQSDDISDLVTNRDDYPNPGPNPSPPDHDYPPPTSWSETKPDVHTDYAPVGPHPSPDYHDYPPPASIV